ncbi:helix-turn-helix transcriptional regulator [Streptomyces sp. NPDC006627]|uniref:helix-turn-helix domain-containing protein n=1 Tax=Streptomyces sp. NPDC006627 TaxID=3154679 RepID=UPI0033AAEC3D
MAMRDHEERPERPSQADGTAHLFSALGKQIKVLREHAGMSRRELGGVAHCGEALISSIESGSGRRSRIDAGPTLTVAPTPRPHFLAYAATA